MFCVMNMGKVSSLFWSNNIKSQKLARIEELLGNKSHSGNICYWLQADIYEGQMLW